jgi:uncharacterized protein YhfF
LSATSRPAPAVIPAELQAFWSVAARHCPGIAAERFYEACRFGDSEAMVNELAELALAGRKRATASLLWGYEAAGRRPPQPGDLSVLVRWDGEPLGLIETRSVERLPFDEVPASFAAAEGEGDGSLAYWRQVHWDFFSRECAALGRSPAPDMPVLCEHFELLFALRPAAA